MATDGEIVIRLDTKPAVSALITAAAALQRAIEALEELAEQISDAGTAPAEGEE